MIHLCFARQTGDALSMLSGNRATVTLLWNTLGKFTSMAIQLPGHSKIWGNELADFLAKEGANGITSRAPPSRARLLQIKENSVFQNRHEADSALNDDDIDVDIDGCSAWVHLKHPAGPNVSTFAPNSAEHLFLGIDELKQCYVLQTIPNRKIVYSVRYTLSFSFIYVMASFMNCLYTLSTELKRMLDVPFHRFHDSEAAHFFRLLYTSLPVPHSSGIHVESMELDLSDASTERERAQAHEERLQRYEEQISDIKRYKEDLT